MWKVLQYLNHLHGTLLEFLMSLFYWEAQTWIRYFRNVSPRPRERKDHLPPLAGNTLPAAALGAVGCFSHEGALLARCKLDILQDPQGLVSKTDFQTVIPFAYTGAWKFWLSLLKSRPQKSKNDVWCCRGLHHSPTVHVSVISPPDHRKAGSETFLSFHLRFSSIIFFLPCFMSWFFIHRVFLLLKSFVLK